MSVTIKDTEHIAHLSRLKFEKEELEAIKDDLNNILTYVEELSEVNIEDTPITVNPIPIVNRLREDVVVGELKDESFMNNFPERVETYLKVPKLLGGEGDEN